MHSLFTLRALTAPLALLLAYGLAPAPLAAEMPVYESTPQGVKAERFVDDLLGKMSLEEKLGQMSQIPLNQKWDVSPEERVLKGQVGSFLFIADAKETNRLQHLAVERGPHHIPLIFGFDVIHGFRTIYPIPLAMAASWDPVEVEHAQSMAARESSAAGVNWTFAPMVDIARDPRWGRMLEGAGEDPYLGSRMAEAQVRWV